MTGIAVFYRYEHVLILIGGRNRLDISTFVIDIIHFIKKMLENVGHICGFITVIAFSPNSNEAIKSCTVHLSSVVLETTVDYIPVTTEATVCTFCTGRVPVISLEHSGI
jgi:hypothetical protein